MLGRSSCSGETPDLSEEEEWDTEPPEMCGNLNKWTNYIHGWQQRFMAVKVTYVPFFGRSLNLYVSYLLSGSYKLTLKVGNIWRNFCVSQIPNGSMVDPISEQEGRKLPLRIRVRRLN